MKPLIILIALLLAMPAFALTHADVDKAEQLLRDEKEYATNLAEAKDPAAIIEVTIYLPSKTGSDGEGCRYHIATHINDQIATHIKDRWYCESTDLPYQPMLPSSVTGLEAKLAATKVELAKLGVVEEK